MTVKEARSACGISQKEAAALAGMSLRSYHSYENDPEKTGTIKYQYLLNLLSEQCRIDETHGILSMDRIRDKCTEVFRGKDVDYCYLFGSYAKGNPGEQSDVDLLISSGITGIRYYSLVEELRTALEKKVDLLDLKQLDGNQKLLNEILKYGVKIYAREE